MPLYECHKPSAAVSVYKRRNPFDFDTTLSTMSQDQERTQRPSLDVIFDRLRNPPPGNINLAQPRQRDIDSVTALHHLSARIDATGHPFTLHNEATIGEIRARWNDLWAWCICILQQSTVLLSSHDTASGDLTFADTAFDAIFRIIYSLCREDTMRMVVAPLLSPTSFRSLILSPNSGTLPSLCTALLFVGRRNSQTFRVGVRTVFELSRDNLNASSVLVLAFFRQSPYTQSVTISSRFLDTLDSKTADIDADADDLTHLGSLINIMYVNCTAPMKGAAFRDAYLAQDTPTLLIRFMGRLFTRRSIKHICDVKRRHSISRSSFPTTICSSASEAAGLLLAFLIHQPGLRCQMIEKDLFPIILCSMLFLNHDDISVPNRSSLESRLMMLWNALLKNHVLKGVMQCIVRSVTRISKSGLENELLDVGRGQIWDTWQNVKAIGVSSEIIRGKWRVRVRSSCGNSKCGVKLPLPKDERPLAERRRLPRSGVCLKCKEIYYCSKICQRVHWLAGHRLSCERFGFKSGCLFDQQFFEAALDYDVQVTFADTILAQELAMGGLLDINIDYRHFPPTLSVSTLQLKDAVRSRVTGIVQDSDRVVTCVI
ncbi:hypothetical protein VNI00_002499 [Paramarasmius palmivorus]|uniref:MYND-type domain-containing protein n=1 Tax=Paramarasmius palmivorus TaxID=297713 RepID=A0AAW0DYV7_9AGAR